MKVIALKQAFFGGSLVQPGQTLDVPDGLKASWFTRVDAHVATKPKGEAKQKQVALSQVGKDEGKSFVEVHAKDDLA